MQSLPSELSGLNIRYVKWVSSNELSSSCPNCGGIIHQGGEYPDRFRVWLKSRATGNMLGWCRVCGFTWAPKRAGSIDPQARQRWIEERKEYEAERKSACEKAMSLLNQEQAWINYHNYLTDELKNYYRVRGISDYWIDYKMLGYNPNKYIGSTDGDYYTPTMTIPVFQPGSETVLTIRHRLLNPKNPGDKYRPEFSGLPAALYSANHDEMLSGKVLLVEGEFKALTSYITLDNPQVNVVGLPGKSPDVTMLDSMEQCDPVIICLDPDAYSRINGAKVSSFERLSTYFKERARIIRLPYKIDDMIVSGVLDKSDLNNLVETARKI